MSTNMTNEAINGTAARSTLSLNCVLCSRRHLSFECPKPLMAKNLNHPVQHGHTVGFARANGEKMFPKTRKGTDGQEDINNNSSKGRTPSRRGQFDQSLIRRHCSRPIQPIIQPPPPLSMPRPLPIRAPAPLMQAAPLMSHGNATRNGHFGNRSGRTRQEPRHRPNPGAFCGSRSMGTEIRNGSLPSMQIMEEVIKVVRPFVFGGEEMYEEHPLPKPKPPQHARKMEGVRTVPEESHSIPDGTFYGFERVTVYDLNGNELSSNETTYEYQSGDPRSTIILTSRDGFVF